MTRRRSRPEQPKAKLASVVTKMRHPTPAWMESLVVLVLVRVLVQEPPSDSRVALLLTAS